MIETYTAVYKVDAPAYTEGLEFALSDDETYYSVTGYEGSAVDVTDRAQNAEYLTDTYRTYYWKRTE